MMEWHGLMNKNSRLLLFYAALMLVAGYGSKACFQEERAALLNYKEFLKPYKKSVETSLSSWANDPNSDCCEWERVTCDPASGRVIRLSLHFLYGATKPPGVRFLPDSVSACLNFLRLNFSLFLPFKDLRSLDLSSNCFNDSVLTRDYGGESALKMLETLDLSNCAFNSSILEMLRSFKSLKTLLLSNNKLDGAFPVQELLPLQNLERLDLSSNALLEMSPWTMHDFKRMSTLKKLETLDLSDTYLAEMNTAGIFKNLSAFKSLKVLALRGNSIAGPLAIHDLSLLQNLETLDLSDNQLTSPSTTPGMCITQNLRELYINSNNLTGNLASFSCLGNLTSLRALDLSNNALSGNIPSSFGAQHTLLELLSLSDNNFEGTFPLSSLTNYSKLKVLRLGGAQNKNFQVETENPPWVPSFQLEYLDMANCEVNLATRTIPTFLSYQRGLRYIDLSNSNLVGSFPNWLLVNNPKLEDAFLNNNYFNGSFLLPSGEGLHTDHLYTLDISHNKIQDKLPETLGFFYPNLRYLNASKNVLDGDIPASIGEMSFLKTLDLAYNNFSGKLPSDMFRGCTSLQILRLSHNGFRGQILPAPLSIIYLKMLMVDNNHFNGTLQDGLRSLQDLRVLDISNNNLSGELPGWVGNSKLRVLSASWNNFEDAIPTELCELEQLVFVSLSHNRFSGAIPSCLGMPSSLMYIHLQKNSLVGTIPESLLSSKLSSLDLGDNNITGGIPKSVNGLANLWFLSLAGNRLQGQLPRQICELKGLYILDLSRNNFTGPIPTCLNNISFGNEGYPVYSDFLFCYFEFLYLDLTYTVYRYLHFYVKMYDKGAAYWIPEEMQLTTKGSSLSYKGNILDHMTGLDLSFNRLEGKVPQQLGDLIALRALNLSHNNLEGSIPRSFQKLNTIESLDLSFNKLSGPIPPQLQSLNSLSVFNVSYNNLSGQAPDKGQFATFDESSYRGNPYLSWSVSNHGIATPPPPPPPPAALDDGDNNSAIDFTSFFWTFGATYVMAILMFIAILWINPYWRRVWFYFIEDCLYKCFGRILKDTFN